jgi:phage/plasmid-associated DNA primase
MSFKMTPEEFKKAQMVLNCQNGYLDLENMQFVKTDSGQSATNLNTNIKFPDAPDETIQAEISTYMESIFPDSEVREYVIDSYAEKLDGYRRRSEELVIHIGSGANGKSLFRCLIQKVFGTYCHCSTLDIQNNIPQNARIVNFSEHCTNKPIVTSYLRELLDGANYQLHTTYRVEMKDYMYMGTLECNQVKFDRVDNGLKRRVKVVPWTNRFTDDKQDHCLMDSFAKWAPQFLWMLFERYKSLKSDNFKRLDQVPAAIVAAAEEYIK